jgi:2-phospho-L-lactate guanylyltransferase
MTLRVIIAARGGPQAKSRLAGQLDGRERAALAAAMLADMLKALIDCPAVDRVYVVTPTPELARIAAHAGAVVLLEHEPTGLNDAFETARRRICADDPGAIIALLPGDLPLVDARELAAAAARAGEGAVVIVQALGDGGTGAIVHPANLAPTLAFGNDSFRRHCAAAMAAGYDLQPLSAPGLGFDVDRLEDLERLAASGRDGATAALARALRLGAGAIA